MKREIQNVQIEDMSATGKAVARQDGKVIFIEQAVPGDVVDLFVYKKKKNFLEARVTAVHTESSKRVAAQCDYFGTCGGCKWQNVDYAEQLKFKESQVRENIKRIGKVEMPEVNTILPSEKQFFYRNKLEFTFSNKRWLTHSEINSESEFNRNGLGFHKPGMFDKVLDIEKCHLQEEPSNDIRNFVRKYAFEHKITFYDIRNHTGVLRNLIIRTATTGNLMVILQLGENKKQVAEDILSEIESSFPTVTSLFYIINTKKNDSYQDLHPVHFSGDPYITETMRSPVSEKIISYRIGPKSFYQTNSIQAEQLYKQAFQLADLQGNERVYDLYTGTGTIANYIAEAAQEVIGIEYVPEAIEDAKKNAEVNGFEHLKFFAGDMKELLTEHFFEENGRPDVVITDPPRAGMHADVCEQLLKAAPEKIVYVSCNPATQARDIEILSAKYQVVELQPVDMFPHTPHVENIALLKRI